MEIVSITLPATNRFATEYIQGAGVGEKYFHYHYLQEDADQKRLDELWNRSFMRVELAQYIDEYMSNFPRSKKVEESIEKLKKDNSVVVIGGQQAGILTGPLYTIHKIISIIRLAKDKEEQYGIPVVPIFWIAGEDHDFEEVNHVYVKNKNDMEKWTYPKKILDKRMVTDCPIDRDVAYSWIEQMIKLYGETDHSKELLRFTEHALKHSTTFVDFFSYMIMELFKDEGLLIIDSGDRKLRKLEKDFFKEMILRTPQITDAVRRQQELLVKDQFHQSIWISDNCSNLFFYDEENFDRILLEFDLRENKFVGKNGEVSFSKEELLAIAANEPEKLSNNVVTRPLMQDLLFPTLAFIAGPGEIAYWAELKKVFELFNIKMPPIVPRLNITLLERDIEGDMKEFDISVKEVLEEGVRKKKEFYLQQYKDEQFEELFLHLRNELKEQYKKIERKTKEHFNGFTPLVEKNEQIILEQIQFLERKIDEAFYLKHQVTINKFHSIEIHLRPINGPQERVWNVFYYLNKYGFDLIKRLTNLPYTFDGKHKIVKI